MITSKKNLFYTEYNSKEDSSFHIMWKMLGAMLWTEVKVNHWFRM